MNTVDYIIILFFYLSFTVFVVGSAIVVYRWIFTKKGKTNTYLGLPYLFTYPDQTTRIKALKNILTRIFFFLSMKYDRKTQISSALFHWSLWIIIAAHFDMFVEPTLVSYGISKTLIETIALYAGTILGVVFVICGLYLLYRRIADRYLRHISNFGDYFSLLLLITFGFTGTLMRYLVSENFAYSQVAPFISGLFTGTFVPVPPIPIFILHFLLACTLILYFPFSKLLHPVSFFTNPTLYTVYHER